MQIHISWRLPKFIKTETHALFSWDGQIYYQCKKCGAESRFHPAQLSSPPQRCPVCRSERGMSHVAHAVEVDITCRDCHGHEARATTEFEEIRCKHCMSENLEIVREKFEPPFPSRFGDATHHEVWGENSRADLKRLLQELSGANATPDFPTQMLQFVRFLRRLEMTCYSESPDDRCDIINVEANLLRDYFRRTFVFEAGAHALSRFEEALSLCTDSFKAAAVGHNVAMAAYSLLVKYPDEVIERLTGERNIRANAIATAEAALQGYASTEGFSTREREMARVHHLLGDLLTAGSSRPEAAVRDALDHYQDALDLYSADPRFAMNVRVSRVNALWKLPHLSVEQQSFAVSELETILAVPETGRIWPEQHLPRLMLGSYYADSGRYRDAVAQLEQAAALVLNDIDNAADENALSARIKEYVPIFSALARAYAALNRPLDAFAAMESLRGATIRLHTMSQEEKKARVERAARTTMAHLLGESPEVELRLAEPQPMIQRLRSALPQTAAVGIDIHRGVITTVIDAPGGESGRNLSVDTRTLDSSAADELQEALLNYRTLWIEPSPFREAYLQEFFRLFDPLIFKPLRQKLAALKIDDALVVVPGPLYGIPADIEAGGMASGPVVLSRIRMRYVPSLGVAVDLLNARCVNNGRILIVGYAGDDLPGVAEEVNGIKAAWGPGVTVMRGSALTKQSVLSEMARRQYAFVHFCCHGTFDEVEPERSSLGLTSSSDSDATRITAADLRRVDLSTTTMVSLSACSSGVSSIDAGNDLLGLMGSLYRSGVRSVVCSRWPVDDDFACRFMVSLYGKLRQDGTNPADAFRATRADFSSTEPMENWAAFSYVGV